MTTDHDPQHRYPALAARLLWTNLWSWSAITVVFSIYVLHAYSPDSPFLLVLARQGINWMPFAFVMPLLCLAARHSPDSALRLRFSIFWGALGLVSVSTYLVCRQGALWLLTRTTAAPDASWWDGIGHVAPIAVIAYAVLLILLLGAIARLERDEARMASEEMKSLLIRSRLSALQSQLQPHFLFNTLQVIEDTSWNQGPAATSRMILKLSSILRASLAATQADQSQHDLEQDLGLARDYMSIQSARFGDRLRYREHIDESLLELPMPVLFFQPLLENAVAHGIEALPQGGEVTVDVRREKDRAVIRIANDGPVLDPAPEPPEGGIGLGNTVTRFRSLHGDTARFALTPRPEGGAVVEFSARFPR